MKNREHEIQCACVRYFRFQYPEYLIFAVPNGGQRNVIVASKMKAEGALAGVADLIIAATNKIIFVEMKTDKGRQSESQRAFQAKIEKLGFSYEVCHSFDEFKKVLDKEFINITQ